jgi:transposase-like protein
MEDYPKTLLEFEERFATEKACRDYLAQVRWPQGFRCPRCDHDEAWLMRRGVYWCRQCKYQVSVTAGTIFQDTRKPLRLWFRAMWHIVSQKHGISALGLQRVLGIKRYETMWLWLHKLRTAMVRPKRDRLSGTVEVDETYIGGKKPGKRGRGAAGKTLVLIAVEDKGKHLGRIRLRRVTDASGASLIPAVQESVEPGSVVRTDGWRGYRGLPSKGYEHMIVREDTELGDNLLPLAHRVAALLKRWLGGTHQGAVRPSHLDYYLDEYTFRFNRRTSRSRGKLFFRLVQQAVAVDPVTGVDIRGGRPESPDYNI